MAPLQPADVFVLLKGRHYDGSIYSEAEVDELRHLVDNSLRPVSASIESVDLAEQRYSRQSGRVMRCLYPEWSGQYESDDMRHLVEGTYAYWWGAWYLGWQMVSAHEQSANIVYETVVMARADNEYLAPVRSRRDVDPHVWYSAWEPPDAFWIMPRIVAHRVLATAENAIECSGLDDCCSRMAACKQISWYNPCYWSRHFHLTIHIDEQAIFRVRTHHLGWRYSNEHEEGNGQIACAPWRVDESWRPWGDAQCTDSDMPCNPGTHIPGLSECV